MSNLRVLPIAAALIAFGLMFAGCTPDNGGGSGGAETLKQEDSPLYKLLSGVDTGGPPMDATDDEKQEYWADQTKQTEEVVARCMKEQGFEYTPTVPETGTVIGGPDSDVPWEPDKREWVEKYGYGMISSPYNDQPMPEPSTIDDPNMKYVQSLSESEQTAYYEALQGKPQEAEPVDGGEVYEYRWEDAGCHGLAQHEVMDDVQSVLTAAEHKPLMDAIEKFYNAQSSDPALAELDTKWATCMADAGYTGFKVQSDAANSINKLVDEYYTAHQADWEKETPDESLGTMKDPEWASMASKEVETALADLTCREKTDYRNESLRIQFAAEEQFIADHKAEIDALIAAVEQGQGER